MVDLKKTRFEKVDAASKDQLTGFLAMNRSVAYPATIVARMIGSGQISKKGVLSPVFDVPYDLFIRERSRCGIRLKEEAYFENPSISRPDA